MYPSPESLTEFLTKAHHSTYADERAKKAEMLRPSSHNYHFEEEDFAYHDTYFGGKKFIGEEVVYWKGKPVWGMNYYGTTVDETLAESFVDSILRPALMETPWSDLPVRGPKHFEREGFEYVMQIREGNMTSFSAEERIVKNGALLFRNFLHGGWIE